MRNYIGIIIIIILSVIVLKDGCLRKTMIQSTQPDSYLSVSSPDGEQPLLEQNIIHLKSVEEPALPVLEPFREQENPFKPSSRKEQEKEPPSLD